MSTKEFTCKAYDVWRLAVLADGSTKLIDDMKLGVKRTYRGETYYQQFTIGSVVGYALRCGDDPEESLAKARQAGHELQYIFATGTSLTAEDRPRETLICIEIGMVIRFHGKLFTIAEDHNDNLKLLPCPGVAI